MAGFYTAVMETRQVMVAMRAWMHQCAPCPRLPSPEPNVRPRRGRRTVVDNYFIYIVEMGRGRLLNPQT